MELLAEAQIGSNLLRTENPDPKRMFPSFTVLFPPFRVDHNTFSSKNDRVRLFILPKPLDKGSEFRSSIMHRTDQLPEIVKKRAKASETDERLITVKP